MSATRALVPYALSDSEQTRPAGENVIVWDGAPPPPTDLTDVGLYVVPYGVPAALEVVRDLPHVRAVQLLTAGYEHALAVVPPHVDLHNGRGLHDASTAEHALALMLAAQRDLPRWVLAQREHTWTPRYTRSLADCRVLLVGYGSIGQAIERRLVPFETTVTRVAGRPRPQEGVHGVDDLPALLPTADIVVLVLPDTPATRDLIAAPELALLPDDALVVNVGRGTALNIAALLAERGRVRAALDVVQPEPLPPDHPLWSAPGVLITPHVAGGSASFEPRARRFVADQVHRWFAGEPLANLVEREA